MAFGYSGCQIGTFLVLLLGTAGICIALFTPYWATFKSDGVLGIQITKSEYHDGLLYRCASLGSNGDCFFRYKSAQQSLEGAQDVEDAFDRASNIFDSYSHTYEFIVLILMAAAAALGLVAIVMAPCCCHRAGACQSFIVFLSALSAAAGIVLYVIFRLSTEEYVVDVGGVFSFQMPSLKQLYQPSQHPFDGTFGWSFFVGVIGALLQFSASTMFCLGRGRAHAYSEQI